VVEIFCTHVQKWKKKTCVKVFQEAGEKGEWRRGWVQLGCIVRTLVNVTVYPPSTTLIKKKKNLKKKQNLRNLKYVFPTLFSWEINFIFAGVARATLPQVSSSVLTCTPYLIWKSLKPD
jgi:hypothetical protein